MIKIEKKIYIRELKLWLKYKYISPQRYSISALCVPVTSGGNECHGPDKNLIKLRTTDTLWVTIVTLII